MKEEKEKLVDAVINQIKKDINLEDVEPLHGFLMNINENLLKGFLPERKGGEA